MDLGESFGIRLAKLGLLVKGVMKIQGITLTLDCT